MPGLLGQQVFGKKFGYARALLDQTVVLQKPPRYQLQEAKMHHSKTNEQELQQGVMQHTAGNLNSDCSKSRSTLQLHCNITRSGLEQQSRLLVWAVAAIMMLKFLRSIKHFW